MDTITQLLRVVAERDARQFPQQTDHEAYAKDYVLEMLRMTLDENPGLKAYYQERVRMIGGDLETSIQWEPQ